MKAYIQWLASVTVGVCFAAFPPSVSTSSKGLDKSLDRKIVVTGTVKARRRTLLTAPFNGYVKQVHVHLGDKVAAGAPIVTLVQSLRLGDEHPLRSPYAGTVVDIFANDGEYVDTRPEKNPLVLIEDLSGHFIDCEIPESEISTIKVGFEATLKTKVAASHPYRAVVRTIALAAHESKDASGQATTVFNSRLEVLDANSEIRSGMTASLEFMIPKEAR